MTPTDFIENAKDARLLIADDAEADRKLIRAMLAKCGITNVTEAVDGKDAENKIWESVAAGIPFRLVILDWMMPKKTGLELTKLIRAEKDFKKLGIFLLTGVNEEKQVKEALKSGVTDYILKPVHIDLLKLKLMNYFFK